MRRIGSQITPDNYIFYTVKEFIYLGFAITTKMVSFWRSSAGSLLPTDAIMVSIGN